MEYKFIKNLDQLKKEADKGDDDYAEFYIILAGGLMRSCKMIKYYPEYDDFSIIHEIDDSYEELKSSEIEEKTNFIEVMSKNAFVMHKD